MLLRAALVTATAIAAAAIGLASSAHSDSGGGCYIASSGDCVPSPGQQVAGGCPPGATAICQDGDCSYSEHPYSGGTCHGHGGVQTHLT